MTSGVLDTTVVIHLYRKNQAALGWFAAQQTTFSITPVTWMELMVGVANKRAQSDTLKLLSGFEMIYLNQIDMDWAMQQMEHYRLSHGITTNDCFIASVCDRLRVPLYTHNLKDMNVILDNSLVIKPY